MTDEMGDSGSVETDGGAGGREGAAAGGEGPNVGGKAGAAGEAVEGAVEGPGGPPPSDSPPPPDGPPPGDKAGKSGVEQALAVRPPGAEHPNPGTGALQYDLPLDYAQKPHRPEVQELLDKVETLPVSTGRDKVVLYSGPGNRYLAESYAEQTGRILIDETEGGKWLAEQKLYENVYEPTANPKGLTHSEANLIWSRLSQRYVEQASGSVSCWVTGSRLDNVFWSTELAALERNDKVTKVNFLK